MQFIQNGAGGFCKEKVYLCKIYNNNILIKNFNPCYLAVSETDATGKQCPSGTIGLYDTIEGKFYTNQGEGNFIKGPEV